jgi:hypothetical protein
MRPRFAARRRWCDALRMASGRLMAGDSRTATAPSPARGSTRGTRPARRPAHWVAPCRGVTALMLGHGLDPASRPAMFMPQALARDRATARPRPASSARLRVRIRRDDPILTLGNLRSRSCTVHLMTRNAAEHREIFTIPALSRRSGFDARRLREAVRRGELRAYSGGSAWPRVLWPDFLKWLKSTPIRDADKAHRVPPGTAANHTAEKEGTP